MRSREGGTLTRRACRTGAGSASPGWQADNGRLEQACDDSSGRGSALRAAGSSTPTSSPTSTATTCRTCRAPIGRVRLELQADCYAGAWRTTPRPFPTTPAARSSRRSPQATSPWALDAASRIGGDLVQENLGSGRVDQDACTHGSPDQQQRWFLTGYEAADPAQCDTFGTDDL